MTGLSYKINNQLQTCTSLNITEDIALPFDFVTSTGKIQQLSPDQFFYHANDKFDYLGKRNVRGMSADVWVTKTTMLNKALEEVIVEWYFAPPNVRSWNEGSPYYKQGNYRIPVRFRSWKGKDTYSLDLNIFHVDYTKLMYGSINIRSCYPNTQSNYFQLVLAGGRELVVSTNIEEFKWRAVHDLANTAGVRWIRIADLKVYYEQNDAIIEFEMLDAPKYAVDIDTPLVAPLTLQQAAKNLLDAAASGTLSLKVYDPFTNSISKNLPVTSAQNTGTNNDPGVNIDNGFSAGALAGLGVAMAIVGGAGGGVGAYFLMR
ncbi:uncharacterized protein LOC131935997 [Physella acuta]|uniref:uncharacterized protein LOC131935997 n=1 Tax=Physella acuta TaxID=109671 RepID=UPI0027DBE1E8|nr:uncharacterized protein LOC131935997 [Physella acuta]